MSSDVTTGELRPRMIRLGQRLEGSARSTARKLIRQGVTFGAPPRWFGWRHVRIATPAEAATRYETIDEPAIAKNRLPENVASRADLPTRRHWWGYSFHDVPQRLSSQTAMAVIKDATIVSYRNDRGEFYPAILSQDCRSVDLREIRFRNGHAERLRAASEAGDRGAQIDRAVWVLERVYENHSHWLTAHLPKILLLKRLGMLDQMLLPANLNPTQKISLRLLGIDPESLPQYDETRPLRVSELTLFETDRFRPELLRSVREAMAPALPVKDRTRRLYISRSRARFRTLLNEDALLPMLLSYGFERVFMEELSFEEQIEVMRSAQAVVAPHGAGLTNIMFCAEGTHIVEIASPDFPNPNFYAVAAAMGQRYYWVGASEHGDVEPLQRNLMVAPEKLRKVLDMIGPDPGAA